MKSLMKGDKIERDAFDFVSSCFENQRSFHWWGDDYSIYNTEDGICLSFIDFFNDIEIKVVYDQEQISKLMGAEQPHTKLKNYFLSQLYNALVEIDNETN